MRTALDRPAFEVMNATADDWESIDQIMSAVGRFVGMTDRFQVAKLIVDLISEGLLEVEPQKHVTTDGIVETPCEYWFRMTTSGRALWSAEAHKFELGAS
jgi:hypothetical protein